MQLSASGGLRRSGVQPRSVGRSVGRSSCLSASVCPNLVLPLWQLIMDGDLSAFFFFMNILRITTKHTIATLFFYAGCGLRF